jgi:hypothetical protein
MADGADALTLSLEIVDGLSGVAAGEWDALANPPGQEFDPFLSHAFLEALEASGSAAPRTGWAPRHLLARDPAGRLVGAAPLYLKSHSRGEFVFDQGWADALERAGGRYYPKLLCAVPFTPVTGRRLLAAGDGGVADAIRSALLAAMANFADANGLSSVHVNFVEAPTAGLGDEAGYLPRIDQQFHWFNRGYGSFEGYLDALASRKRKAIRKERAAARDGLTIRRLSGAEITEADWDAFFAFYQDTGGRKWGSPYLNRGFFRLLDERLRDRVLLVMAFDGLRPIAGALNLVGSHAVYGRYWGRIEPRPFLHFEVCYHQAIEFAIERGLARVEAGAQGEHKLARGYEPVTTRSLHWIAHPGLRDALEGYLARERAAVADASRELAAFTPFRRDDAAAAAPSAGHEEEEQF